MKWKDMSFFQRFFTVAGLVFCALALFFLILDEMKYQAIFRLLIGAVWLCHGLREVKVSIGWSACHFFFAGISFLMGVIELF